MTGNVNNCDMVRCNYQDCTAIAVREVSVQVPDSGTYDPSFCQTHAQLLQANTE